MTIVLVDGPDGVGKTGYARWLAQEFGFLILRLEPDDEFGNLDRRTVEQMSSVFNETLVQLNEQNVDVIVDRGPVSSLVYSMLHGDKYPEHAISTLDDIHPVILYLKCDSSELEIRYSDEKFDDVAKISNIYDEVMENLKTNGFSVIEFDTSSGVPDQIRDAFERRVVHA